MANLVADQEMIAILADMAGSVAPALSPIKSPKRQRDTDSSAEIPEPALKQQPPIQNSVALENYLEETKLELASIVFNPQNDNISANERKAINTLKRNSEINLKKADKGTTTVIMDTAQKNTRRLTTIIG